MQETIKQNRILSAMTYIVIFGDLIKVPGLRIAGFTFTLFRLAVLFVFFFLMWRSAETGKVSVHRREGILYLMVIAWIVWAAASLMLSPYSDRHAGTKEILSLISGLFILFIFFQQRNDSAPGVVLCVIRNSVWILAIFGLLEVSTGIHFYTSRLAELENSSIIFKFFVSTNSRLATGIFYNENDFCCFLAVFGSTILYSSNRDSTKRLLPKLFLLVVLLFVFLVDDANIAIGSLMIGLLFLLFKKKKVTTTVFLIGALSVPVMVSGCYIVWGRVNTVIHSQVQRYHMGAGSLYLRVDIYKKSLEALRHTNGLGTGAGGFSNYISQNYPNSILINPHNVWLEILTTYGVIVFVVFVVAFFLLLSGLIKRSHRSNNKEAKIVAACFLSFVIGGLIPSSFLGYNYLWLLLGLGCITSNIAPINSDNIKHCMDSYLPWRDEICTSATE